MRLAVTSTSLERRMVKELTVASCARYQTGSQTQPQNRMVLSATVCLGSTHLSGSTPIRSLITYTDGTPSGTGGSVMQSRLRVLAGIAIAGGWLGLDRTTNRRRSPSSSRCRSWTGKTSRRCKGQTRRFKSSTRLPDSSGAEPPYPRFVVLLALAARHTTPDGEPPPPRDAGGKLDPCHGLST